MMAQQVTNSELYKEVSDLKGAIGRIEGLLVGISKDLVTGAQKFNEMELRMRAIEMKMAVYGAAATVAGAALGILAKAMLDNWVGQ